MSHPTYQDVLLRLLSMWELHFAKLEGRSPRTRRRSRERSVIAEHESDMQRTSELTKSQYLSQRVARALEPLAVLLHESDLRFIKIMLEERLRTDPHLVRIVERATRRFR